MDYISDLEKIKQEIDKHPLLKVVTYEVAPPVKDEQIKLIEQKYPLIQRGVILNLCVFPVARQQKM